VIDALSKSPRVQLPGAFPPGLPFYLKGTQYRRCSLGGFARRERHTGPTALDKGPHTVACGLRLA